MPSAGPPPGFSDRKNKNTFTPAKRSVVKSKVLNESKDVNTTTGGRKPSSEVLGIPMDKLASVLGKALNIDDGDEFKNTVSGVQGPQTIPEPVPRHSAWSGRKETSKNTNEIASQSLPLEHNSVYSRQILKNPNIAATSNSLQGNIRIGLHKVNNPASSALEPFGVPIDHKNELTFRPLGGIGYDGRPVDTSRMRSREIWRIIDINAKVFNSEDTLTADYYFIKAKEKEHRRYNELVYQLPPQGQVRPTNLLTEIGSLIFANTDQYIDETMPDSHADSPRKTLHAKFNSDVFCFPAKKIEHEHIEWDNIKKALGRLVKSNIKRPRELISQDSAGLSTGTKSDCFKDYRWVVRKIVCNICDKLIEINDNIEVIQDKVAAARKFEPGSVSFVEGSKAISSLRNHQLILCNELGMLVGYPSVLDPRTNSYNTNATVELIDGWNKLFALIWTPRGRASVLRSLPCLLQPHQRSLLKTFCTYCAYFICRSPDSQDDDPLTDEEAKIDLQAAKAFDDEFRNVNDLAFVTDCLVLVHQVFEQTPDVLSVFLHTRSGQQIIRTLVVQGKALSQDSASVSTEDVQNWISKSESFYVLMKKAVSNIGGQSQ